MREYVETEPHFKVGDSIESQDAYTKAAFSLYIVDLPRLHFGLRD